MNAKQSDHRGIIGGNPRPDARPSHVAMLGLMLLTLNSFAAPPISFQATGEADVLFNFATGEAEADLLGTTGDGEDFTGSLMAQGVGLGGAGHGNFVLNFSDPDGSTLQVEYSAIILVAGWEVGGWQAVGGTGRYAGATGGGKIYATFGPLNFIDDIHAISTGSFELNGTLSRAAEVEKESVTADTSTASAPTGTELHVLNISFVSEYAGLAGRRASSQYWAGVAVVDEAGLPVSGAEVSGDFSGDFELSGATALTDDRGLAMIAGPRVNCKKDAGAVLTFTVSDITLAGAVYNPDANQVISHTILTCQ